MEGLEPPHLAASDPKSDVSTNFTTSGKRSRSSCISHRDTLKRAANVGHFTKTKSLKEEK